MPLPSGSDGPQDHNLVHLTRTSLWLPRLAWQATWDLLVLPSGLKAAFVNIRAKEKTDNKLQIKHELKPSPLKIAKGSKKTLTRKLYIKQNPTADFSCSGSV